MLFSRSFKQNARAAVKLMAFGLLALNFFFVGFFLYPLYILNQQYFFPLVIFSARWHNKILCTILNLRIELDEEDLQKIRAAKGKLFVCNHLSYLDVIAFLSLSNFRFVTSMEVKKTFFLGQITQLAGCLYVERRNKQNIAQEIGQMTDALKRGENVIFFPEATSTDGETVIRFRTPLFNSAIASQVSVVPMALRYLAISTLPVSRANRDTVCWYGDMEFFGHFWKVLKEEYIYMKIELCQEISTQHNSTPIELAQSAHQMVLEKYESSYCDTELPENPDWQQSTRGLSS